MKNYLLIGLAWLGGFPLLLQADNVIFIHPDGAGISHWQAARMLFVGPDNDLAWDKLEHVAVYRGHMSDSLTASSNGGATVHAYGTKQSFHAFGSDGEGKRPVAASGFAGSLAHEAMEKGLPVGLINSGSIIEPGTAAFVATVGSRGKDSEAIALQVIESGVPVILSGGEEWLLPKDEAGRHTTKGRRSDGRNLVSLARELGYTVVYTREELEKLPDNTAKVLGIFAAAHTFNDMSEEELARTGLPLYATDAPTVGEMTKAALRFLTAKNKNFFLVVEEEGSDNFGNYNNTPGTLEALRRADEAFSEALTFLKDRPDTLIITAADSSAGAMDVISYPMDENNSRYAGNWRDRNGAPWDRPTGQPYFISAPDRQGKTHPFIVTWGTLLDASGGIVVRAMGRNAEEVKGNFDNTQIYDLMHRTLFPTPAKAAR